MNRETACRTSLLILFALLAALCPQPSANAQEPVESGEAATPAQFQALGEQALKDAHKLRGYQLDSRKLRTAVAELAGGVSLAAKVAGDTRLSEALAKLQSPLASEKVETAESLLVARGLSAEVLLALVECLGDSDPKIRIKAAAVLVGQENLSRGSLAAIALALEDHDRDARTLIVRLVGDRGEAAKPLAVPLEKLFLYELSGESNIGPDQTIRALAAIDPHIECWREGLGRALLVRRSSSVTEVRRLFVPSREQKNIATSTLVALLGDKRASMRVAGLYLLAEIGTIDTTVLSQLDMLLYDKSSRVRLAAVRVLLRWNPTSSKTAAKLKRLLNDPGPYVRMLAATRLATSGKDNAIVVAALASALNMALPKRVSGNRPRIPDNHRDDVIAALNAISQIGSDAKPAVPAIARVIEYSQFFLRRPAISAIQAIDPEFAERYKE